MPIKIMKRYTREYIQENDEDYFIFGDNYARTGLGGQAGAARGEPNAIGIRTKISPDYGEGAFMTDENFYIHAMDIMHDFAPVIYHLEMGSVVVWPEDGIGTGLASLPEYAPNILKLIELVIESLKNNHGVVQ